MEAGVEGERDDGKTFEECNIVRRAELQWKEVEVEALPRNSQARQCATRLGRCLTGAWPFPIGLGLCIAASTAKAKSKPAAPPHSPLPLTTPRHLVSTVSPAPPRSAQPKIEDKDEVEEDLWQAVGIVKEWHQCWPSKCLRIDFNAELD